MATNEVKIRVTADDRASRQLGKVKQEAGGMGGAFKAAQSNWLALSAGIAATAGVTRVIGGMVAAASELEEATSKNRVIFGEFSRDVEQFAGTAASSFGISKNEALAATGAFGNMLNTVGLLPEASSAMSVELVKLASDMASFNDADPSEMLIKLRSGLAGEAEPLRQMGVLLSAAEVSSFAFANGIANAGDKLTEAQKVQARYGVILAQTAVQQGDFERTSEGLANQQRILTAEMENLRTELGTLLLPAMTEFISLAVSATSATNNWAAAITELAGVGGGGGTSFIDRLQGIGSGIEGFFESLGPQAMAPAFALQDLLDLISGPSDPLTDPAFGRLRGVVSGGSGGGGSAAAGSSISDLEATFNELADAADMLTTGAGGGGGMAALILAAEASAARADALAEAESLLGAARATATDDARRIADQEASNVREQWDRLQLQVEATNRLAEAERELTNQRERELAAMQAALNAFLPGAFGEGGNPNGIVTTRNGVRVFETQADLDAATAAGQLGGLTGTTLAAGGLNISVHIGDREVEDVIVEATESAAAAGRI